MFKPVVCVLAVVASPFFAYAQVGLNVDVETAVRAAFADAPVMIEIARCESKFRQYTDSGNPLYGGYQGKMVGVFQIYSDVHASYAKSLGMDIETLNGNLAYANHLYEREGTQPWISSFSCWGSEAKSSAEDSAIGSLSTNLSFGMEHREVRLLQQLLNQKGFVVAAEGPGSPGNETERFGFLTREAVRKFQCERMQICAGDEYSTGYGFVGSKTRAVLAEAAASKNATSETAKDVDAGYSEEEQSEIEKLQRQITELTLLLNELLKKKATNAAT